MDEKTGAVTSNEASPAALRSWSDSLAAEEQALSEEILGLEGRRSVVREKLRLVKQLLDLSEKRSTSGEADNASAAPEPSARSHTNLEDAVAEILVKAGVPLHVGVLREQLIELRFPIPGRGDDANIIVRLRADPERFTRTARGTYGLSSWGIPELKPKRAQGRRKKSERETS